MKYIVKYFPIEGRFFLCSKDIQVGDKYFLEGDEPYEFERKEGMEDFAFIYAYKVLGKISEGASWVKEGDEFDEMEVFPHHTHDWEDNDRIIYLDEDDNPTETPVFYIQCPCCKTFK